jgi:head-tail adaptor
MAVSRVGKLKNQITLQNTNLTTDNVGGYTTGNTTFITSFAKITPKGGKEIFYRYYWKTNRKPTYLRVYD